MDLENRIGLLVELGEFMQSDDKSWMAAKTRTFHHNAWFVPDFIELAVRQITEQFLQRELLENWVKDYQMPGREPSPKKWVSSWPEIFLWPDFNVSLLFYV
jgi:hypothetical protein